MTEPAPAQQSGIGAWIGGFVVVLLMLVVGLVVAGGVGFLVPRFPGRMGIEMCLAALPLVWLAKRSGGLTDVGLRGVAILSLGVVGFDWIVDVLQIPGQVVGLVGSLILGLAYRFALNRPKPPAKSIAA
jgi:hypothetical protein